MLGNTAEPANPNRYAWEPVRTGDPDVRSLDRRLLLAIAQRTVWRQALDDAKRRAGLDPPDTSTTGTAAGCARSGATLRVVPGPDAKPGG